MHFMKYVYVCIYSQIDVIVTCHISKGNWLSKSKVWTPGNF